MRTISKNKRPNKLTLWFIEKWNLISRSKEDMAAVRDVYVEQGIIEPAESSDSGGSSNESEGSLPV